MIKEHGGVCHHLSISWVDGSATCTAIGKQSTSKGFILDMLIVLIRKRNIFADNGSLAMRTLYARGSSVRFVFQELLGVIPSFGWRLRSIRARMSGLVAD